MKQDGKRRWFLAVLVTAVAACTLLVQGDVATPRPRWTKVCMVSEVVNIKLGQKKVYVEALFNMHNTGTDSNVRFGYPLGLFEEKLNDFKVFVEDKELTGIKTEKKKDDKQNHPALSRGKKRGKNVQAEPYRFSGPYKEWKLFDVPFKADEKKKIKITYWVKPAQIKDKEKSEHQFYSYTLVTGATWKGTIKKAVINLKLDGVLESNLVKLSPAKYKKKDGIITWTMKEFKPTENIEVLFKSTAKSEEPAEEKEPAESDKTAKK